MLNIKYINANDISDIGAQADILNSAYNSLVLNKFNKDQLYKIDEHDITHDSLGVKREAKVINIIRKIRNILYNEIADSIRETKIYSFVMTLFQYLGFDDEPFLMHPQYDYTASIGISNTNITSKVDYMITKQESYIVFIIEDKHSRGTSELTDWSEHQIAGEIFIAAYHNLYIANNISYPFYIQAIRIVGTKFTFYKAEITKAYLEECAEDAPSRNSLIITRYPKQQPASTNSSRMLTAWDFCDPSERIEILKTLRGLHDLHTV